MQNYNSFIIAIKTNYEKNIAFFIPTQFKQTKD